MSAAKSPSQNSRFERLILLARREAKRKENRLIADLTWQ
jgi:hypothetical protein